ncbi:protein phosphatase 1 regulatory subunit 12A-like [Boleophthalmus pectinirostris]|uniref:protein phosphatase 1 regulatory subunit 12A-like n=1 Tax=Boleophthalmus pectinirostris TaxID=150288 RepID=UPI0024319DC0|nr:protein phosphatase 1 regulatory subunit 12A-like [Boleophthalmus pectinirostris]
MQAFAPRHFLAPVRDDEAESQRKAKSRHARQTRRSTLGVTLTDLKEAHKSSSLSPLDPQPEGAGVWEDNISLAESVKPKGIKVVDNQGNIEPRLEVIVESPGFFYTPITTRPRGISDYNTNNSCYKVNEGLWRDENHNPTEDTALLTFTSTQQPRQLSSDVDEDKACAAEDA